MLRRALHSIARIQRESKLACQMPVFEDLCRGTQASAWRVYESQSERQAGSSRLTTRPSLLSNKGLVCPSFSQDKGYIIQSNTCRKDDSSLIGEEKRNHSLLEGLGTLCGLASHLGYCGRNFQSIFLSDEIRADSVRRKRKKKMNKHKHAKRRKLNRHRR